MHAGFVSDGEHGSKRSLRLCGAHGVASGEGDGDGA